MWKIAADGIQTRTTRAMAQETKQEREQRLAEALRRNLARRKQAKRSGTNGSDDADEVGESDD